MKTKALVVDDSRTMRAILRRMLTELGFEVAEAAEGRDALGYLQSSCDTCVALVDWNMPGMDGLALVEAVRGDARFNDLRMMMVTTETEMANVERALNAGADEYIMKPFSKEAMRDKLQLLGVLG